MRTRRAPPWFAAEGSEKRRLEISLRSGLSLRRIAFHSRWGPCGGGRYSFEAPLRMRSLPSSRVPEHSWMTTPLPYCFLNVLKPPAMTSHDVVARLRRLTGLKVGHTGTLDPAAAGVLVLCLGVATRLAGHVVGLPKSYRGEIEFGLATSTGDAEGVVLERSAPPEVRSEELAAALECLTGTIRIPTGFLSVHVMDGGLRRRGRRDPELEARVVSCIAPAVRFALPAPRLFIESRVRRTYTGR